GVVAGHAAPYRVSSAWGGDAAGRMGAWRTTGAQVAGDVAITGRVGADGISSAPGQQDFPAASGDDDEVARDTAVPGPAAAAPGAPAGPATPAAPAGPSPAPPPGTSGGAAVRRRLARLGAPRGVNPVLEPLTKTVRATHPKADVRLIERAYEVAAHWHAGQKRKSGDPYITHPLAVATILAELGMNHETICAALLHDTVEDTPYTL